MASRKNKKGRNAPAEEQARIPAVDRVFWLVPSMLAFALYIPALRFGFIFDDYGLILLNPQVHTWDYLPRLLSTHLWSHVSTESMIPQYRPMFSVWLLLLYSVGGQSAWFWHFFSVLLHVLATYLVFRLGLEILGNAKAASVAALLFATHPIHIEPVCWISSCNELVYTNLVLLSLLLFCRSLRHSSSEDLRIRGSWLWLSVVLWTAAIFTKESALAVLPAFFYLDFRARNASLNWWLRTWHALKCVTPYLSAVVVYFVARLLALGRIGLEHGRHSWAEVVYSTPSILVFYLRKLTIPTGLSGFYVNRLISAPTAQMLIMVILLLIGIGYLVWLSLSNVVAGLASMLLFLPMFPVIAGIRTFGEGDLAHDRYMYLPSVGLCLLVGLLAKYSLSAPKAVKTIAYAAGGIVVLAFAGLTLAQQGFYRNAESYFGRGVEVGPNNVTVLDYLGDVYLGQHRAPEALEKFRLAHNLEPDNPHATFSLAKGLFAAEQYYDAEPYLEELAHSNEIRGNHRATVLLALGQSEIRLNHLPHAEEILKQLKSENESFPGAHDTLGAVYEAEGKIPEAQSEYAREFQISGNQVSRQKALVLARVMRGQTPDPRSAVSPRRNSLPSLPLPSQPSSFAKPK